MLYLYVKAIVALGTLQSLPLIQLTNKCIEYNVVHKDHRVYSQSIYIK